MREKNNPKGKCSLDKNREEKDSEIKETLSSLKEYDLYAKKGTDRIF